MQRLVAKGESLRTTQMTVGLKPQDFLYLMKRNHLTGLQAGYGITLKA